MRHNGAFQTGGDFRRTGGLRAVADHAGGGGKRVGQGHFDLLERAARKVGQGAAAAGGGADRAAIGRQAADAGFDMNGQQIRQRQRAEHALARDAVLPGVDHHGQRGRRALISAAGDDDHGQGAAAHARVGRGGGVGLQELAVLAVELADVDAPVVRQTLLRDFQVAVDLTL